jgi:hypothetical protein
MCERSDIIKSHGKTGKKTKGQRIEEKKKLEKIREEKIRVKQYTIHNTAHLICYYIYIILLVH